MDKHTK